MDDEPHSGAGGWGGAGGGGGRRGRGWRGGGGTHRMGSRKFLASSRSKVVSSSAPWNQQGEGGACQPRAGRGGRASGSRPGGRGRREPPGATHPAVAGGGLVGLGGRHPPGPPARHAPPPLNGAPPRARPLASRGRRPPLHSHSGASLPSPASERWRGPRAGAGGRGLSSRPDPQASGTPPAAAKPAPGPVGVDEPQTLRAPNPHKRRDASVALSSTSPPLALRQVALPPGPGRERVGTRGTGRPPVRTRRKGGPRRPRAARVGARGVVKGGRTTRSGRVGALHPWNRWWGRRAPGPHGVPCTPTPGCMELLLAPRGTCFPHS